MFDLQQLIKWATGPLRLREMKQHLRNALFVNAQLKSLYRNSPSTKRRRFMLGRARDEQESLKNALTRVRRLEDGRTPFTNQPK